MRRLSLLIALSLLTASGGMHAAPPTPVIVELFTSEGCSDCPPADTLLEKLITTQPIAGVEIVGLGQHVDYWDRQGWKDQFSSAAWTSRQQIYQGRFATESIYTPQMVVDGRAEFVGSDAAAARKAIERTMALPHGVVQVTIGDDRKAPSLAPQRPSLAPQRPSLAPQRPSLAPQRPSLAPQRPSLAPQTPSLLLQIAVSVSDLPTLGRGDRADIIVAIVESGLRTDVKRGENRGRMLLHAPVVRSLAVIGHVAGDGATSGFARADIPLAAGWQCDHLAVVAFVQELRGRTILASASVPLKNARP